MAATQHLGVRTAVAALFAGLAGGRIQENRDLPLSSDEASRIDVVRVTSTPTLPFIDGAPIDWATEIDVIVRARAAGDAPAEAIADDLVCECFARVMASQDLGGLAQGIEPGEIDWEAGQAEGGVEKATLRFTVTHTTTNNVIT